MTKATLTLRDLNRATLARQMLLAREATTPLRAIERLVGLQAQLPKPTFVGLWSRVAAFDREALTKLLARRDAVRATMMRGTLHLVTAKDYVAFRGAIQPVLTRGVHAVLKKRVEALDVDALVRSARAYFDEAPRTFTELREFLMKLHPKADERAMGFTVRMMLPLVQVPTDARWGYAADSKFAVAETWLGARLEPGDAVPALVLRYLAAFGPASASDVQAWSGLQGLKPVIDALRPKLVVLRDERGRELFDLPKAPRPDAASEAPVRFIPEYDNLVVSRADARFIAKEHRPSIFLSALRVRPTFLVDGFAAGTWKIERKKAAATLVVEPFAALPKKVRGEVDDEGSALVRFAEEDASTFEVRLEKPR